MDKLEGPPPNPSSIIGAAVAGFVLVCFFDFLLVVDVVVEVHHHIRPHIQPRICLHVEARIWAHVEHVRMINSAPSPQPLLPLPCLGRGTFATHSLSLYVQNMRYTRPIQFFYIYNVNLICYF
jgi:hypothetical protein